MRALLIAVLVMACAPDGVLDRCDLGRAVACTCSSGATGAQECGPSGVWSPCVCSTAGDAGAAREDATPRPVDAPGVPEAGAGGGDVAAERAEPADGPRCPLGWGECVPGACVDLSASATHCGRCGAECSPTWRCERGTCVSPLGTSCDLGRADCDRNESNGCEAALRVDHTNCGACGNNCRVRGLFCREGSCAP